MPPTKGICYGDRIKEIRKRHRLTQMELAVMIGLNAQNSNCICRWEKNLVPPTKRTLQKIADAVGESVYILFPEAFPVPETTLNEYQKAAQRTSNTQTFSAKIENGLFGLAGEVGELHDIWKKYMYQNHEFDKEHMKKELGDVMWYVAELACGLDCTLEDIAQINIAKLKARYPEGFDAERSLHRAESDI